MEKEFARIGVLIADRLTFFRRGMAGLLQDLRPAWHLEEAETFDEVLRSLRSLSPDLVLLDLELPGLFGAAGVNRLRALHPNIHLMVLADSDDRETILDCLGAGAHGYMLKSATPTQFLRAVDTILSGGVYAPASLTGAPSRVPAPTVVAATNTQPALANMTERQRAVFQLLAQGCATKTIARRLDLAVGTVKVHLAAIYRLLGAHSRMEAVAKACGGGIIVPVLPVVVPAVLPVETAAVPERLN